MPKGTNRGGGFNIFQHTILGIEMNIDWIMDREGLALTSNKVEDTSRQISNFRLCPENERNIPITPSTWFNLIPLKCSKR